MAAGTSQSRNKHNALTSIEPATQAYVRAWGKHEKYTYYIVSLREKGEKYAAITFNLAVNEVEQKTYLLNMDNVCVVSSVGGLQAVDQSMHIKSLEFRELTAHIDEHWLRDLSEMDSYNQMQWYKKYPLNQTVFKPHISLFVEPRKNAKRLAITVEVRSSTILATFGNELSPWKKIILLMAMVKLYYCGYKMNLHPIPNGILAFMPPGIPSPPSIDSLQDINNVILRISCMEPHQRMMEVLNADNLQIQLVACIPSHKEKDMLSMNFKDSFGQVQFSAIADFYSKLLTVLSSSKEKLFGTIGLHSNTTVKNENGLTIYELKPIEQLPGANPSFQCFGLFDPVSNTPTVQSYVDKFCLLHITNLSALPNTAKALALAYKVNEFIFCHQLIKQCFVPIVDKYGFNSQRSK